MSAKVNLPLPYVPMTLQTLVVLMIGAAYGWLPAIRPMLDRRG
jgi:biotin transport system substrate-specific component